ncbi:hypothetical protein BDZ97DRAFT_1903560 [Flammula alnicola]|nr:hypothetical protein BDZ97DRAFT_1903560 [Flammula alnicola]
MGGSAFSAVLAATAFPRLPPPVYRALKARLSPTLAEFYAWVGVPAEAPEKIDHGDLDLLVTIPKSPHEPSIPHDVIKQAIGAKYVNPMDGNRTSNYAVPIKLGEWGSLGHAADEEQRRASTEDGEIYYQVDIHVCFDKNEYDRILFFHSYGDMGMILGLIARNSGIALGAKGLKIPDPPNPPFELSQSFDDICQFLGLSLATFHGGFNTREEVYKWATSSKYFDPSQFRSAGPGITKVKAERTMYADFVEWVEMTKSSIQISHGLSREERHGKIREEALLYFNKKQEYENIARARLNRTRLKEAFSGSRVRDWTELGQYWKGVKLIMDEVRERMGGEDGILEFLDKNTEDDLKEIVLQVKADLGIQGVQQQDDNGAALTDFLE